MTRRNPEAPRCVFCDVRQSNQADLIAHRRACEIEACRFCQENKGQMAPRHFASPRCESGKRNHCSCDFCF